jgi:hypothetical protein
LKVSSQKDSQTLPAFPTRGIEKKLLASERQLGDKRKTPPPFGDGVFPSFLQPNGWTVIFS